MSIYAYSFVSKRALPQREIFTIGITFRALSVGDFKNKEKVVQQGQKSKIPVNYMKLP
jgi:hypothetical protein